MSLFVRIRQIDGGSALCTAQMERGLGTERVFWHKL